jgi:hypothetical protein
LATSGVPADRADQLIRAVVGSAGAAIDGLAAQPQTAAVADAARAAMAHGVTLGSYLVAAFLLAGLVATLLISASRREPEAVPEVAEQQAVGRHRRD